MNTKNEMYDILSDIECICAEMEDIEHLLILFDENVTDELKPFKCGKAWADEVFLNRWPLYQSIQSVILLRTREILKDLQSCIRRGYDYTRTDSPAQT